MMRWILFLIQNHRIFSNSSSSLTTSEWSKSLKWLIGKDWFEGAKKLGCPPSEGETGGGLEKLPSPQITNRSYDFFEFPNQGMDFWKDRSKHNRLGSKRKLRSLSFRKGKEEEKLVLVICLSTQSISIYISIFTILKKNLLFFSFQIEKTPRNLYFW